MKKLIIPIIGMIVLVGLVMCSDMSNAEDGIDPQADERTVVATVNIGPNQDDTLIATIYDDGECVISGTATETYNNPPATNGPFYQYRNTILKVTFDAPNLEIINRLFISMYARDSYAIESIDWGNAPIKIIKAGAFVTSNLHYTIPQTIERLEGSLSTGTTMSETVVIPDSCQYINVNYFKEVTGIKHVVISQTCRNGGSVSAGDIWSFPTSVETVTLIGTDTPISIAPAYSRAEVQHMPQLTKLILKDVYYSHPYMLYQINPDIIEYDVDGQVFGWYSSKTYATTLDPFTYVPTGVGTNTAYLLVADGSLDLNYDESSESINFNDLEGSLSISEEDHTLVRKFMVYPTDYETGTDTGVAGMILRLVPVFVLLAILGSIAYMFVNRNEIQ